MKRLIPSALVSCALFLVAPCAHALIDSNSNGLSDLWEKAFNGDQLFSAANPDHAPAADPDNDGWSNIQEATAGTNPFDAKSPEGIISPLVAHTPAIREPAPPGADLGQTTQAPPSGDPNDPFGGGASGGETYSNTLEIRRPAHSTLTWPTVAGKAYGVLQSADLATWGPASDFFMGEGNPLTYQGEAINSDNTEPAKLFYRIKVEDADSDDDNLTDYEEGILGTVPFSADTDKDGIADGIEYSGGSDPLANTLASDPDGGGLPASLATGLIGRWDFENVTYVQDPSPYYNNARYPDSVGTNHVVPFFAETKAKGMPSKAAGATTASTVGYLCPPRTLLHNRTVYSVSLWADIEKGSITASRPRVALFSHHRQVKRPADYQALYKTDLNGMWIQRLPDGTQILKAGTYHYRNHYENTNTPLPIGQIVDFSEGVTSAPQPAGTFDDGKFHHYLLVRSSGIVTLYRDGVAIGTNTNVTLAAINSTADNDTGISLGRLYGSPAESGIPEPNTQATKASFDRLRVWSRTLTAAEALSLYRQDIDSDGLWDITESRTRLWRDANSDATEQDSEHTFISSPYIWQPSSADTDGDDLTDLEEQTIGTEIHDSDTDNDRLPDGFEVKYGLNPFVATGADGPDGDPDGDGLSNLREYNFNSKPKALPGDPPLGQPFSATDSDGDGTGDLLEANGDSHPGDASDLGQAIPAAERITLKIGIGDNSGSHSEDYSAICYRINPESGEEEEYYTVHSGGFGQFKEETLPIFRKGQTYTFQIRWNGSNNSVRSASSGVSAEGPDFDYTFRVQPQGTDTGFLIDGYDPKRGIADLTKPLLAENASDVAETQQEFKQNYQNRRVVLMGVSTVSADRMFGASMQVLPGLEDIQLEFKNTVTNEDFGTHSQLFANAYSSYEEMLGAGDNFGKNISDPRVWLIKNEQSAIRRIQAYLCSDPDKTPGEITVAGTFRGVAIGTLKHALSVNAGFGQLLGISRGIASGSGLGFPGATGGTSAHATPATGKAHHWYAALNIPILILHQMDENITLMATGIYNGFIAGLADDAEFVEAIGTGLVTADGWLKARAIAYLTAWAADPALRMTQLKDAIAGFFKNYICRPAAAISLKPSSPDEWLTTFWEANARAEQAFLDMRVLAAYGLWKVVIDGSAE
jgi:hypothetical protein